MSIDMTNFRGKRKAGVNYSVALRDLLPGLIGEKPMSKREISAATGRNFETLTRLFAKLHSTQIHIAGWRRGRSGNPTALWLIGPGDDVPMPTALTNAEKSKRYRSTDHGREMNRRATLKWKQSPAANDYKARYNERRKARYHAIKIVRETAHQTLASIDPLMAAIMGKRS